MWIINHNYGKGRYQWEQDVWIMRWNDSQSDEEKELVWRHRETQQMLIVNNFSQTFVKNAFYFLWIRVS